MHFDSDPPCSVGLESTEIARGNKESTMDESKKIRLTETVHGAG